jgi:glutaredoxin
MKQVSLETLSSPGCVHCKEFEDFWHSIEKNWPNVEFKHVMITDPEGPDLAQKYMIFSSPGIILNNELFAMGGVNKDKFIAKLKELSQ